MNQAFIHQAFFRDRILMEYFFHVFPFFILFKSEIVCQNFLGPQLDFSYGFLRSEFILGISVGPQCNKRFCQLNAVGVAALEICTIG